jgi:hypothetical protein
MKMKEKEKDGFPIYRAASDERCPAQSPDPGKINERIDSKNHAECAPGEKPPG